jgi:DNA-directed RNA polymerase II subunit RPB2
VCVCVCESVCDSVTGETSPAQTLLITTDQIFFGPTFYQRLKHMVEDKIHARAHGRVTGLLRQPLEGRSRGGGLRYVVPLQESLGPHTSSLCVCRFGEMERDVMIAHGSAHFLKERLCDQSDRTRLYVCDFCGMVLVADLSASSYSCKGCQNKTHWSAVDLPYASKQLFQELMSMSVVPRLMVRPPTHLYSPHVVAAPAGSGSA